MTQLQFALGSSQLQWNFSSTPVDASDILQISNTTYS